MVSNQRNVNTALQQIIDRDQWRNTLATDYEATAQRLQAAYNRVLPQLRDSAGSLADRISEWIAANPDHDITEKYVKGFKEYQDLLARVEVEMADFARLLKNEAGIIQDSAVTAGAQSALEFTQAVSGGMGEVVAAAWNTPDPQALSNLVGYVDSPAFRDSVQAFGENAAANVGDVILAGVAQGKSPAAISNIIQNWFTLPAAWADNTVRTVQLWSYRTASQETYKQNSDVVEGWMWWATLDDRTCPACIAMHGTKHTNDETLDGHHGCRCTPLPIVIGTNWADNVKTGPEWFDEQSAATQVNILGPGKYDLYKDDSLDWDRMTVHYENDIFGEMRREATLAELS